MDIQESHDIYTRLHSIKVRGTAFFDGATLARELRSPRRELAATLLAEGAISEEAFQLLVALWKKMQSVQFRREGDSKLFDNIYDLVLWVYVQKPFYEAAKGAAGPARLVFRGQRDAEWTLETTLHRLVKKSENEARDRLLNSQRIGLFIKAAQVKFQQKLLEAESEKQAVAQHYGECLQHCEFATSFLDFSTDVDVAAWFATQKVTESKKGTIFMGDTRTLLKDGRALFVKIPEIFSRPNVQRGLFIKLRETSGTPGHEDEILPLIRLNFIQQPLEKYNYLHSSLGEICVADEVSGLADRVKRGEISETDVKDSIFFDCIVKLHDPERSEIGTLSERLFSVAGVIKDDATFKVLDDVCRELVRASPTAVRNFIATGYLQLSLAYYADVPVSGGGDASEAPWWEATLRMADRLLTLCKEAGINVSALEGARRAVHPKSILLVGSDLGALEERAITLGRRMQVQMGAAPSKTSISRVDLLEIPEGALLKLPLVVDADQFTLIVSNVHCLKDRVGQEQARQILSCLCVRKYGIVATALNDFSLSTLFDITFGGTDPRNLQPIINTQVDSHQ